MFHGRILQIKLSPSPGGGLPWNCFQHNGVTALVEARLRARLLMLILGRFGLTRKALAEGREVLHLEESGCMVLYGYLGHGDYLLSCVSSDICLPRVCKQ